MNRCPGERGLSESPFPSTYIKKWRPLRFLTHYNAQPIAPWETDLRLAPNHLIRAHIFCLALGMLRLRFKPLIPGTRPYNFDATAPGWPPFPSPFCHPRDILRPIKSRSSIGDRNLNMPVQLEPDIKSCPRAQLVHWHPHPNRFEPIGQVSLPGAAASGQTTPAERRRFKRSRHTMNSVRVLIPRDHNPVTGTITGSVFIANSR